MNHAPPRLGRALRAYANASSARSWRAQEADVFRQVNFRLRAAREAGPLERARALADNDRLWTALAGYLQDPGNALPVGTRAGLISIAHSVSRALASPQPDYDFMISVNENIASGLAAGH